MTLVTPSARPRHGSPWYWGIASHWVRPAAIWLISGFLAISPGGLAAQTGTGATPPATQAAPAAPVKPGLRADNRRAQAAFQRGRRDEQSGDWQSAYTAYSEAAEYAPGNQEFAALREHARFQWMQGIVDAAERQAVTGKVSEARALLQEALKIDPNYPVARERLAELSPDPDPAEAKRGPRLAGLPQLKPNPGTREFDVRGTIRNAYEELGRQFGVTIAFDGNLTDRALRFRVPPLDFDTALMVLSRQTRTLTRVVDEHTLFVADDNAQNQRQYAPEIEKDLPLPESVTNDDMNEAVRMVREMTGISRTQLNTASHTLTVRSTEQNVALAQALLRQIEQPHGELVLEIEILEIDKNKALQLGITPPTSTSVFTLTPSDIAQLKAAQNNGTLTSAIQSIFSSLGIQGLSAGSASVLPPLIAFGGGKSIFLATVPGATANFSQTLSAVRSAQRILLRAQDGKPATFFVGDRYPIDLALLSSDLSPTSTALGQASLGGLSLPQADYSTGANSVPVAVAIGDFNTDGHPDIAAANQGSSTSDGSIAVLFSNGDGTFQPVPATCTFTSSICIPIPGVTTGTVTTNSVLSAIAVADFDGDGNLDIAVADEANNRVLILFGDGTGSFSAPTAATTYATGVKPVALLTSDFNGDGFPDLAVVNAGIGTSPGSVSILLGNSTRGKTNTFLAKTDYAVGISPTAITTADFNADGYLDLAVTNTADSATNTASSVSIMLGSNTGTFTAKGAVATGTDPVGIAAADFNSDGHPDLAITYTTDTLGNSVSVLFGDGTGGFPTNINFPAGSGATGVVAADFASSAPDIAVADKSGNNVDVLIGDGAGNFTAPISLPTGNAPVELAASDLTGAGSLDLVSANSASSTVTVTLNALEAITNSAANQMAYPSADYLDLGLKVKATPRLHGQDEVTLHLEFDIKSLSGTSINGIPVLSNRTIDQTVRLRENETSILTGIFQRNEMSILSGLPWISTVPGVGDLTGLNNANDQESELLIVVTPRAVRYPPHDVPALYAGHGEPATPPSVVAPPPGAPGAALGAAPGTPPAPGQPGQPAQPPQPGQPPAQVQQPGNAGPDQPNAPFQPRPQP